MPSPSGGATWISATSSAHPARTDQRRHVRERERQVLHPARPGEVADVATDVEDAVPVGRDGRIAHADAVGEEVDERHAGGGGSRASSAARSARGVAQALPTKTWSPGATLDGLRGRDGSHRAASASAAARPAARPLDRPVDLVELEQADAARVGRDDDGGLAARRLVRGGASHQHRAEERLGQRGQPRPRAAPRAAPAQADVHRDDRSLVRLGERPDGEVVEHAAVHVDLVAHARRREEAGERQRRTQRNGKRSPPVDGSLRPTRSVLTTTSSARQLLEERVAELAGKCRLGAAPARVRTAARCSRRTDAAARTRRSTRRRPRPGPCPWRTARRSPRLRCSRRAARSRSRPRRARRARRSRRTSVRRRRRARARRSGRRAAPRAARSRPRRGRGVAARRVVPGDEPARATAADRRGARRPGVPPSAQAGRRRCRRRRFDRPGACTPAATSCRRRAPSGRRGRCPARHARGPAASTARAAATRILRARAVVSSSAIRSTGRPRRRRPRRRPGVARSAVPRDPRVPELLGETAVSARCAPGSPSSAAWSSAVAIRSRWLSRLARIAAERGAPVRGPELADDRLGRELAHDLVAHHDLEPPRPQQIQAVRGVACAEEPIAGGQDHALPDVQERGAGVRGEPEEERRVAGGVPSRWSRPRAPRPWASAPARRPRRLVPCARRRSAPSRRRDRKQPAEKIQPSRRLAAVSADVDAPTIATRTATPITPPSCRARDHRRGRGVAPAGNGRESGAAEYRQRRADADARGPGPAATRSGTPAPADLGGVPKVGAGPDQGARDDDQAIAALVGEAAEPPATAAATTAPGATARPATSSDQSQTSGSQRMLFSRYA